MGEAAHFKNHEELSGWLLEHPEATAAILCQVRAGSWDSRSESEEERGEAAWVHEQDPFAQQGCGSGAVEELSPPDGILVGKPPQEDCQGRVGRGAWVALSHGGRVSPNKEDRAAPEVPERPLGALRNGDERPTLEDCGEDSNRPRPKLFTNLYA